MKLEFKELHKELISYKQFNISFNKNDLKKGILSFEVPKGLNLTNMRPNLYDSQCNSLLSPNYNIDSKITKTNLHFDLKEYKIKGRCNLIINSFNTERIE